MMNASAVNQCAAATDLEPAHPGVAEELLGEGPGPRGRVAGAPGIRLARDGRAATKRPTWRNSSAHPMSGMTKHDHQRDDLHRPEPSEALVGHGVDLAGQDGQRDGARTTGMERSLAPGKRPLTRPCDRRQRRKTSLCRWITLCWNMHKQASVVTESADRPRMPCAHPGARPPTTTSERPRDAHPRRRDPGRRQHPARPAQPDHRRGCDRRRQARVPEPGGLGQGPHRCRDHRRGGGGGRARAGRHDRRGHVGQHGHRARDGRCGPRLQGRPRDARDDEQGAPRAAARVRCRARAHRPAPRA